MEDQSVGTRQLEFFNYAQGKYLHLGQVEAKEYKNSHLIVDDRRSNNKLYRVVQFGYPNIDPGVENILHIQVINFDFSKGSFDEGLSPLAKQKCISAVEMRGDLVVILCEEDHTISFMLISENGNIKLLQKATFAGQVDGDSEDAKVEYLKLILIRHSSSAYQVYLQVRTSSQIDGLAFIIETYEVFIDDDNFKVFH